MIKLDLDKVKEGIQKRCAHCPDSIYLEALHMRTAVYVMCGGGSLGHFAANQPREFRINDRVDKLPFDRKEIEQAVALLVIYADALDWKPGNFPPFNRFHNCGIF